MATEKGLKPLAEFILEQQGDPYAEAGKYIDAEKGVNNAEEAIAGAKDIIAEVVSDNAELQNILTFKHSSFSPLFIASMR